MVLIGGVSKLSKLCYIPQRYILLIMGSLAIANAYTMRTALSIALTEMIFPSNETDISGTCPTNYSEIHDIQSKTYNWTEYEQGYVLSSFYFGYILTHVPGGILAERVGGKYILGASILWTSLFTLITPSVIKATDGSVATLVALRIVVGFGEGPAYPSLNAILAQWVPKRERAFCASIVFAGAQLGTILSNIGSGIMIYTSNNWEIVFYVYGILGIIWFIIWSLLCYSSPVNNPFIKDREIEYLNSEIRIFSRPNKIPWNKILKSGPVWALIVASFGHDWAWFMMVSDLPKYIKEVLKFDVEENCFWASIPYFMMWLCALVTGALCDYLIEKRYIEITPARKLFTSVGAVGPGAFMLAAVYAGCEKAVSLVMLSIGMGLMGTYYSGMKVNVLDLSLTFAGTIMGIVNGLACIAGMGVPILIAVLAPNQTLSEWRIIFWISLVIFATTSFVFIIWGSAEEQPFNNEENDEKA